MVNNLNPDLHPAGSSLFLGANSFLRDLSEEDEALITGGARSNSRSGRRPKRRRNRKRRRVGSRSRT
jgi:hypothetical protein